MVVKVLSKIGHALSRPFDGLSLGRGSMLLRLRRASLGMLCLVGAVGIGLIAFIAQLDWPQVLSGPIPDAPSKVGRVEDAVSVSVAQGRGGVAVSAGHTARRLRSRDTRDRRTSPGSAPDRSGLGHSRDLADAPSQPSPGEAPPPAPAPTGAGEGGKPAAPPPAASPAPVVVATGGGGPSKENAKATADGGRAALATSKSQAQKTSAKSSAPSSSSPAGAAAAKARKDSSAGKPPTPAPAPEARPSPPPVSPASAKEAADAANSQ